MGINLEKGRIKKYIINNGKIILKYKYTLGNPKVKNYYLIIGTLKDDNLFNSEIIVSFEENKIERDNEFLHFSKIKNIEYTFNKNGRKLGDILLFEWWEY